MKKALLIIVCMLSCASCATWYANKKAAVNISSNVNGIPVSLTYDGKKHSDVILPTQIEVSRVFRATKVKAEVPNYRPAEILITKKVNPQTYINIPWALYGVGLIGLAVDAANGTMMKPEEDSYYFEMIPIADIPNNYVERASGFQHETDTTIPQGESRVMVSREAPGNSALEKTVIRWFFDSEPRGARVFWRVISSIPAQVKNTNESYLGTTPFEETRSFNILGLTYENSRDVQIEIKVTKPGYMEQTKRFNVRQAIDQMEISSFYDLVPRE